MEPITKTLELTTKTGHTVKFVGTYICELVPRTVDLDGDVLTLGTETSTAGSDMVVYIDGKRIDSCWNPEFWGLIDCQGKQKVWGLKIGFSDSADAETYAAWLAELMAAGTAPEVVEARAVKAAAEKANAIEWAKSVIAEAERQIDIPTREEAQRRMMAYNDVCNEGGAGYVPHIYSLEEYEAAKHLLAG